MSYVLPTEQYQDYRDRLERLERVTDALAVDLGDHPATEPTGDEMAYISGMVRAANVAISSALADLREGVEVSK